MGMASVYIKKITLIDHPIRSILHANDFNYRFHTPCVFFWKTLNPFIYSTYINWINSISSSYMYYQSIFYSDATFVLILIIRLPFTAILLLLFQEVTDFWIWIGGLIIFLSSTYVAYRERKTSALQVLL